MKFQPFPKIPRLNRDIVITEKIDGTNAAIGIDEDGNVWAQSRKRLITPDDDNFGFARFVEDNKDELLFLGPGLHFGEWWGSGIQRGYGLKEKRFILFNTARWGAVPREALPTTLHVVPVLYEGPFVPRAIDEALNSLRFDGSCAAPGFMDPEGIVIWHTAARQMFKVTLENDDAPKSVSAEG